MADYGLNIHQVNDFTVRIDWVPVKRTVLIVYIIIGVIFGSTMLYSEIYLQAGIFALFYLLLGVLIYKAISPMQVDIEKQSSTLRITFTDIFAKTWEEELSLPVTINAGKKLMKAPNVIVARDYIITLRSELNNVELWMDTFWKAQGQLVPRLVFTQKDVNTLSELLNISIDQQK